MGVGFGVGVSRILGVQVQGRDGEFPNSGTCHPGRILVGSFLPSCTCFRVYGHCFGQFVRQVPPAEFSAVKFPGRGHLSLRYPRRYPITVITFILGSLPAAIKLKGL